MNCEAYNSFNLIGSDHRIVTAELRLSLRANKPRSNKRANYDWDKLRTDKTVRDAYTVEVQNRFEVLQSLDEDGSADALYENIITAHKESAEKHIPHKPKRKRHVPWQNVGVTCKREALKEAHKLKIAFPTNENSEKLEQAKKDLKGAYNSSQEKYIQEKTDVITNAHVKQQSRLVWETVNEISGRKHNVKGRLKADTPEERLEKWKDHFGNLLGH